MTIRFYVLPAEYTLISTGVTVYWPKYFAYGRYPETNGAERIHCPVSPKYFGEGIPECLVCADILAADHTALIAHTDVLSIPTNIDSTLTTTARNTARTFCATYNIPGTWINTGMTYRTVLRTIVAFFLFFQRVTGILGGPINLVAGWMDLQYQQVPADIQAAMLQAAQDQGFSTANLLPTTTMRAILKFMADAWGGTPILFGNLATL